MEVQDAKYDDKDMHNRRQSLLRYDSTTSHMAYYIRGYACMHARSIAQISALLSLCNYFIALHFFCREEGKEHCAPMMRNLTFPLPSFFSWVKVANYEGQRKVREMSYDVWALTVSACTIVVYCMIVYCMHGLLLLQALAWQLSFGLV